MGRGRKMRKLKLQQALQSSVPRQDSSATVTSPSTSGGAESSGVPNEGIEVDLTDEVILVDLVNEMTEVEDTNDTIDIGSECAGLLDAHPDILSHPAPNLWHKVTVTTQTDDRIAVLNAINEQISPLKLIPYFFRMENGHITFLVSNCSEPLTALVKQNLKVLCHPDKQFGLKLHLNAKRVNLSAVLRNIISERLTSEKKYLDLSNLTSIPEFQQVIYDPSETSHLQQRLLKIALDMAPNLVSLSLAGNELSTLSHLDPVFADKTQWRSLRVLDVTDNKIQLASELLVFSSLPITELHLHKNPVCGKYEKDGTYESAVRGNFPRLIKLDGTYRERFLYLPRWRPNYILCSGHDDLGELADQFVEHFFTLYDSGDRSLLWGLYHKDAYFSLSSLYLFGQTTSSSARLGYYIAESRNLLHLTNGQKTNVALSHGVDVVAKLERLPQTIHDPYSFTVDLLHHSATRTVLTVTGLFKEKNRGQRQDISPRHFMRTFVLVRLANDEYRIVNDILFVTNATTPQAEAAFTYKKPDTNLKKISPPRQRTQVTESDKNVMIEKYSQLTNMTVVWSVWYLEDVGWNLRKALLSFIQMYKADLIPAGRFKGLEETANI